MPGTKIGGQKAAITIKKKYGADYYAKLGKKGGSVIGKKGGFASELVGKDGLTGSERARLVGAIGGHKSSRARNKNKTDKTVPTRTTERTFFGFLKRVKNAK